MGSNSLEVYKRKRRRERRTPEMEKMNWKTVLILD
jgi:hypothetical protein